MYSHTYNTHTHTTAEQLPFHCENKIKINKCKYLKNTHTALSHLYFQIDDDVDAQLHPSVSVRVRR